jgi:8-oxo-dGTP pyrophosphatase MutT (NUDIX family)
VVCVLSRNGEVLLVRHTYGRRWQWDLPGGGLRRGEEPARAAEREIEEELGLESLEFTFLGELFERIGGKHDELWCFSADAGGRELSPSPVEIGEARWFPRDALPAERARYVERVVALTRTGRFQR